MAITETADYILTGTTGVFRSFKDFDAAVAAARTSRKGQDLKVCAVVWRETDELINEGAERSGIFG